MFRKALVTGSVCVLSLFVLNTAHAADIKSLFNTGTKTWNIGDETEGNVDQHYKVAKGATIAAAVAALQNNAFVIKTAGFPIPNFYLGNNAPDVPNSVGKNSKWISTTPEAQNSPSPAYYAFRTTFDLTKFDPLSAVIRGYWLTDNDGVDVFLNGVELGNGQFNNTNAYYRQAGNSSSTDYRAFTKLKDITTGFVSGINTLDFVVYNRNQTNGNPASLRVELTGSAAAIPEPAFLQMSGLLLCGGVMGLRARKRRKSA